MSVTFWCPDAPTRTRIPYPDTDPTFELAESVLPEIQLSNANARPALEMLGLAENEDLVGGVGPEKFDAIIARLHNFVACPVERAAFLEPTIVNGVVVVEAAASERQSALALELDMDAGAAEDPPRSPQYEPECDYPSVSSPGTTTIGELLRTKLSGNPLLPQPNQTAEMVLAEPTRKKGPTVYSFGRDDVYLRNLASRFIDLFTQAGEGGYEVTWG